MEAKVTLNKKNRLLRWLYGSEAPEWGTKVDAYDPEAVAQTMEGLIGKFFGKGRYFPLEVEGLENIPSEPVLFVSNHSGGSTVPDAWGLMAIWYRHFGVSRPIHPLAHDIVISNPITGEYFAKRGVVRADPRLAVKVLREWRHDVLVFPGGEQETWRTYKERYQVRFHGRTGYARLALEAGVPIVPIVHAGSHETLIVLSDGARFAKALRLDKWVRTRTFPIHLSLPWILGVGPWPHIPIPRTFRYRFGEPIYPPAHWEAGAERPSPALVTAHDTRVRGAMQDLLHTLQNHHATH